jgi:hypothetical protein
MPYLKLHISFLFMITPRRYTYYRHLLANHLVGARAARDKLVASSEGLCVEHADVILPSVEFTPRYTFDDLERERPFNSSLSVVSGLLA